MTNIATDFATSALFVLPICWAIILYCIWKPQQAVFFGAKLSSTQVVAAGEYPHSCLHPLTRKIALAFQFVISMLMLSALWSDNWSQPYPDQDVIFGSVYARGYWTDDSGNRAWTVKNYGSLGDVCLQVGGVLTLIQGLVALVVMIGVLYQSAALAWGKTKYHEYHYRAAVVQFIQVWFVLLQWGLSSFITINGQGTTTNGVTSYYGFNTTETMGLGMSWILAFIGMCLSGWVMTYFKNAIEYRSSPTDFTTVPVPIVQVIPQVQQEKSYFCQPPKFPSIIVKYQQPFVSKYGSLQEPLMVKKGDASDKYEKDATIADTNEDIRITIPHVEEADVPTIQTTPNTDAHLCGSCGTAINLLPGAQYCSYCGVNVNQQPIYPSSQPVSLTSTPRNQQQVRSMSQ